MYLKGRGGNLMSQRVEDDNVFYVRPVYILGGLLERNGILNCSINGQNSSFVFPPSVYT